MQQKWKKKKKKKKKKIIEDDATSRQVVGSIPDEVIGFFNCPNPSGRTMALGSTQPLNRNHYQESSCRVKGGRRVRLRKAGNLTATCEPIV
jgi:hypothetical protein